MNKNQQALLAKIWNIAGVVRASGVSQLDYVRQLTYLLFLKMEIEASKLIGKKSQIPEGYNWNSLVNLNGMDLLAHYEDILAKLKLEGGMVGVIFEEASNTIKEPATLQKVISMIDGEDWFLNGTDNGDIYESILEKNGNDKGGAGQYFTPRPLINAITKVVQPSIDDKVIDPACGTGGFLLAAYQLMKDQSKDMDKLKKLTAEKLIGHDITPLVVNLGAMNMYLHGIRPAQSPISCCDSLAKEPDQLADVVLANPPFGNRPKEMSSVFDSRGDLPVKTNNNQLNFLQHIMVMLKDGGRAGVILPDNVLFIAGAGEKIRRKLLDGFNLHTILRLPCGIFYAGGVQANVLFFTKGEPTKETWIYDYRTGIHHTIKENPLKESDLDDFVEKYHREDISKREETWSEANPNGRWRRFPVEKLLERQEIKLNITWIKSEEESGEDYMLEELLDSLKEKSDGISVAVDSIIRKLGEKAE